MQLCFAFCSPSHFSLLKILFAPISKKLSLYVTEFAKRSEQKRGNLLSKYEVKINVNGRNDEFVPQTGGL